VEGGVMNRKIVGIMTFLSFFCNAGINFIIGDEIEVAIYLVGSWIIFFMAVMPKGE